eukprot:CCRYP_000113-RA/>CCRYP_000113-RA protein AED:0.41 eAED:0.43 QI:0/-1/0/1/-1/1/1/0/145
MTTQEAVESTATIKLTSTHQGGAKVSVVTRYPREVPSARPTSVIAAIKAKGLQDACERLVRAEKECTEKLEEAVLSRDLTEGKVRDDSALSKAINKATEAQTKAKSAVEQVANQIFQLSTSSRKKRGSHGVKSWRSRSTAVRERT